MGHFVSSAVTAGPTPQIHAGLNYNHVSYTLSETASGSLSIDLVALPPGARVVSAALNLDNSALADTPTPGTGLVLHIVTGGTIMADIYSTATGGAINIPHATTLMPYETNGYRTTASSNVRFQMHNAPAGSGTATTVFSFSIVYDCQKEGD